MKNDKLVVGSFKVKTKMHDGWCVLSAAVPQGNLSV
jgi:hypothetical protein